MADFQEPGLELEAPAAPSGAGLKLSEIGQRLSRALTPTSWQEDRPRFAVVRNGYHCAAVDEYVGELEQELAELDRELAEVRARPPAGDSVASEIRRVGEQTSAVLIAAHEQAEATRREAEAEAQRRVAEAESTATQIVSQATLRLRDLRGEIRTVARERERLIDEIGSLSGALSRLADSSLERYPADSGAEPADIAEPADPAEPSIEVSRLDPVAVASQETVPFDLLAEPVSEPDGD